MTNRSILKVRTFLHTGEIHKNRVKHPTLLRPFTDNKDSTFDEGSPKHQELKLNKCKKIIISNKHLTDLYEDRITKEKLVSILLDFDREEFLSVAVIPSLSNNGNNKKSTEKDLDSVKDTEKVYIPLNNESWKCYICICWEEILQFRQWMQGIYSTATASNWRKCTKLLKRRVCFETGLKDNNKNEDKVSKEDDDDRNESEREEEEQQDGKNIFFKYDKTYLSPIALKVYVYSKV